MRWQPVTIAILIGCLTTTAFNYLGWLPVSERKLYDYYLRSRPVEPQDKKIIIVGLNERDLEKYGFPLSDDILATLLTRIRLQPTSISPTNEIHLKPLLKSGAIKKKNEYERLSSKNQRKITQGDR